MLSRFAGVGDEFAFAELVRRHGPMVRAVCRRILRDDHLADDACQAAFLVLARKAGAVRHPIRLAGWLYGVSYRTALKARARRLRAVGRERPLGDAAMPAPPRDADWADLWPVLDDEVNRLPDRYRETFVLCVLEGRSLDDAATILGCAKGTVGSRLSWCRERLRARLVRRGVTLSATAVAAALADAATAAPLPGGFATGVAGAAVLFLASTGAVEGLPATGAALAEAVLRDLASGRWRLVVGTTLLAGAMASGAAAGFAISGREPPIPPGIIAITKPAAEEQMGLVREFVGHTKAVTNAAFTPDGRRLVTTSGDKTARIWDIATGREIMKLAGHTSPLQGLAVLPDNRRAVTTGSDGTIRLWDLDTGHELRQYAGHASNAEISGRNVDDLVEDMRRAIAADTQAGAQIPSGDDPVEDYRRHLGQASMVVSLTSDQCGARLITCGRDGTARMWDVETGKELVKLIGHTGTVWAAQFLPDGQRVITTGSDRTIRIWDVKTARQLVAQETPSVAYQLNISPDGRSVAFGCDSALLWLEINDGLADAKRPLDHAVDVLAQAANPDPVPRGGLAVSGRERLQLGFSVDRSAFLPDGRLLFAGDDGVIRVWTLNPDKEQHAFAQKVRTFALVADPDGRHVVTTDDKTVRLWRLPDK